MDFFWLLERKEPFFLLFINVVRYCEEATRDIVYCEETQVMQLHKKHADISKHKILYILVNSQPSVWAVCVQSMSPVQNKPR